MGEKTLGRFEFKMDFLYVFSYDFSYVWDQQMKG